MLHTPSVSRDVHVRSEDKSQHAALAARLATRTNCVVAVPNYRLTPSDSPPPSDPSYAPYVRHPQHARDILRALCALIGVPQPVDSDSDVIESATNANADADALPERNTLYDPTHILLAGHSCGAHILSCIFLDSGSSESSSSSHVPVSPSLKPPQQLLSAARALALSEGIYDLDALLRTFPDYRSWFVENAFGPPAAESRGYARFSATHYPLHKQLGRGGGGGGAHLSWLIIHSSGDTLVDAGQAASFFAHLSALYSKAKPADGGTLGKVEKDWTTLTFEHNDMLRTAQYSNLLGDWLMTRVEDGGQ